MNENLKWFFFVLLYMTNGKEIENFSIRNLQFEKTSDERRKNFFNQIRSLCFFIIELAFKDFDEVKCWISFMIQTFYVEEFIQVLIDLI